jgi:hypothetical protein
MRVLFFSGSSWAALPPEKTLKKTNWTQIMDKYRAIASTPFFDCQTKKGKLLGYLGATAPPKRPNIFLLGLAFGISG